MNRSQSWNQYLLVQKKVIKNEIENFWRSTELTLAVFCVPSNNPDKYLRDVFKEKRQQRKRETKKQNHMFYLLQEKRKKTIFCMRLPCDQKRMNSSNTGTYPRSHMAYFHTQRDASLKTSSHISVQKLQLLLQHQRVTPNDK